MQLHHRSRIFILGCFSVFNSSPPVGFAQGTGFTYQGRLNDGANTANGIYDLRFTIYDSGGGPGVVAGPATNSPVVVSNGLFTVTLDPGAGVFTGAERWLEIGVRTNGGGAFTALSPRQPFTPAPYAIYAPNAGVAASATSSAANAISASALQSGAVTGDKIANGTITAADVQAASFSNTFWKMDGNAGTTAGAHFLGTTDNQPLEFRANGLPALRLEPVGSNTPNVVGGFGGNVALAPAEGAVIAGGGLAGFTNAVVSGFSAIGGGAKNVVAGSFSGIGAGINNLIQSNANSSVVSGGNGNVIANDAGASVIAGGFQNLIGTNADAAAIGGGWVNEIAGNAAYAVVGGGRGNVAGGLYAVVPGGRGNTASGDYSVALGRRAKAVHVGALVLADATDADVSSTTTNELTIRALGGVRVIAGAAGIQLNGQPVISGVVSNASLADAAVNSEKVADGTIAAADVNSATFSNTFWKVDGNAGTTTGTHFLGTTDNQALEFKVNALRALRLVDQGDGSDSGTTPDGAPNVIGGSPGNFVAAGVVGAVISGGGATNWFGQPNTNAIRGDYGAIGGGAGNLISQDAAFSVVGGGRRNTIGNASSSTTIAGGSANLVGTDASYAFLGGGLGNVIGTNANAATVAGGQANKIGRGAEYSVISGGYGNTMEDFAGSATIAGGQINTSEFNSLYGVIGGGSRNRIVSNSIYATIPGGSLNTAASHAFAAGHRAKALHSGAFVWADSQDADFASTEDNQFLIRAAGGVGIGTTVPDAPLHVQSGSVGVGLNSRTVLGVERAGDTFIQVLTTTSNYAGVVFGSAYNSLDASVRYNAWGKQDLSFRTDNNTRMIILTNGYVGIANASPTNLLMVSNARCDGSSWINASDRRLKQDFVPVDTQAVLEKVASLPVQQWSYQAQPDQKHLGPVAQDFRAAFGLGADDTSIATVDADGVALAAIQGLYQKVELEKQRTATMIQKLESENLELREELAELRALTKHLTAKLDGGSQ